MVVNRTFFKGKTVQSKVDPVNQKLKIRSGLNPMIQLN